jgi:hypothetical protein
LKKPLFVASPRGAQPDGKEDLVERLEKGGEILETRFNDTL